MFSFHWIRQSVLVAIVLTLSLLGFTGGRRNGLTAYAETEVLVQETEETREKQGTAQPEISTETIDLLTEAKLQIKLPQEQESMESGQKLVGDTIAKNIQITNELRDEQKAVVGKNKDEIRRVEEERERIAKEEAEREARRQAIEAFCSGNDYEVLKRIVEAEAGICDIKGRILVANVIINRVRSSEFPNTISGVVYQKSQFSPVMDGRINTCKVTDATVEAVNRAIAGEDYSDGALYFMNRNRSRSKNVSWFDSRLTYLFYHDKHEFFK